MEKMTAFTDSEYTYLHELDLDGIKERVERVCSAFEWVVDGSCINVVSEFSGNVAHQMDVGDSDDAEFIAHARQDVPALIAEVERLREENERLSTFEKQAVYALEENRKLREALQFYADVNNYEECIKDSFGSDYFFSNVTDDEGRKARITLGIEGANDD